jgi:tetratricopeptide (TPR) repeat protein
MAYARYVTDPKRAHALLAPACDMIERLHPEQVSSSVYCLYYLGFLTAELGEPARAAQILSHAAALGANQAVPGDQAWDQLARGYALFYRGSYAESLDVLRAVSRRLAAEPDKWWAREFNAHARLGMGLCEQALHRRREAIADLEFAARVFTEIRDLNEDAEHDQRLSVARRALAALEGSK